MTAGLRVLHLYWNPPTISLRAAISQHLQAVSAADPHGTLTLNAWHPVPARIARRCDAIVLHTTFLGMRWCPAYQGFRDRLDWLGELDVPKLALPQDEYDHAHVLDDWLADWGITDVFSNFGNDVRPTLYPRMASRARFHRVLTGYIDPALKQRLATGLQPLATRPNDIVYRASRLPLWFGHHGQLKHEIAGVVKTAAEPKGLRCDISTDATDTIHGDRWFEFLASSRTTIGVESGSSVLDARGEVRQALLPLHQQHAQPTLEQANRLLPADWDSYKFHAISPRHFEAALCKTAQILVEGDYEGILQPEKHYLPLRKDFSNLGQILQLIKNNDRLTALTDQAYTEICAGDRYSYSGLTSVIQRTLLHGGGGDHLPRHVTLPLIGGTPKPTIGFRLLRSVLPGLLSACGLGRWLLASGPAKIWRHAKIAAKHRLAAFKQIGQRRAARSSGCASNGSEQSPCLTEVQSPTKKQRAA